jgi:hypothetical protein
MRRFTYRIAGAAMFDQPEELRELAEWYRVWAELGNARERVWRRSMVDFLEKRASEIEVLPMFCQPARQPPKRRIGEKPQSGYSETRPPSPEGRQRRRTLRIVYVPEVELGSLNGIEASTL